MQVVYERAVAAFPVTHYLWAQYARYLEAHLKIGSGEEWCWLHCRANFGCRGNIGRCRGAACMFAFAWLSRRAMVHS